MHHHDHQDAIDRLLEHYESPRNRGALEDADVVMPGGQPHCGDTVTMYLKVDETKQRVARLSFEGEGCSVSQAAASILTEIAEGQLLTQVEALDQADLIALLGRDIVRHRPVCANLALNTLKAAIAQYRAAERRAQVETLAS